MKLGYFIKNLSKVAVIDGAKHIKKYHLPHNTIIGNRNPLVTNCVKAVNKHADAGSTYSIASTKINSYLAASSLAHLLDGWMYLSNSFHALLNGDEGTSMHLAYYAELRSAMAILASEGMGIFDRKHIGVFSKTTNAEYPTNYFKGAGPNTRYVKPSSPTHVAVWDAMEKWSNSSYKPDSDILRIFKVRGHDFFELTEFFHPGATSVKSVEIVKTWLKEWCLDIRLYRSDREGRNEVSYRPQRISGFNKTLDFGKIISDLSSFWTTLSPSQRDPFSLLDIYLLRKLFSTLHSQLAPTRPYEELVENSFNQIGLHDQLLVNLLTFQAPFADETLIIREAKGKQSTSLSMIARASLLLRIAVGLVSQIYKSGNITKGELNFVWDHYGVDCGFWKAGGIPEDFETLWTDVSALISDLKVDVNSNGVVNNLASIRERNGMRLNSLSQINRACLWGIDLA
jgi:hypothetical protein